MTGSGVDTGLRLAALCKALGHPARVAIVQYLATLRAGAPCGEIVGRLPLSQSTVSQHLAVLRKAGFLVTEGIPPKVVYKVDQQALSAFRRAASLL